MLLGRIFWGCVMSFSEIGEIFFTHLFSKSLSCLINLFRSWLCSGWCLNWESPSWDTEACEGEFKVGRSSKSKASRRADRQEKGAAAPAADLALTSLPVGLHGRGGARWSASKITHLFGQEVGSSCCLESQMEVRVEVSSLHIAGWASVQHDKWEQEPASGTWIERQTS